MTKWMGWLMKMTLGAALVAGVTLYATWMTVSTYVESLLVRYHMDTPEQKLQFSDFLANVSKSLNIVNKTAQKRQPSVESTGRAGGGAAEGALPPSGLGAHSEAGASGAASAGSGGTDASGGTTGPGGGSAAGAAPGAGAALPGDGLPAWSRSGGAEAGQKRLVMSADDFYRKKENLSEDDKMTIFTLLANSLPPEELQKMSNLVEDGITADELADAQKIVEKYLTPEQFASLMGILNKYE